MRHKTGATFIFVMAKVMPTNFNNSFRVAYKNNAGKNNADLLELNLLFRLKYVAALFYEISAFNNSTTFSTVIQK